MLGSLDLPCGSILATFADRLVKEMIHVCFLYQDEGVVSTMNREA